MLNFACDKRELSCIIGNLFAEIEPPCDGCGGRGELTISGTTHNGERVVLIVTEHGFKYSGSAADIHRIRERRCLFGTTTATKGAGGNA